VNAVRPIFIASCYDPNQDGNCHNVAAAAVRGNFSVYSAALNGIEAHLSDIKYRINLPLNHIDHMPQGSTLSPEDLSVLNIWLDEGGKLCR
jgi:hypothetical protein